MPAITSAAPDLSGFPPWQYSGAYLPVGGPVASVPIVTVTGTLPIGAVLGQVSTTGAYVLCDPLVNPQDGSQTPVAVLASQASAGPPPVAATVYPAGQFSIPRLFYSANWTIPALLAALAKQGIFGRSSAPSIFN